MSFPFNYGMSIYMPPGPDMNRVDKAWDSLAGLLESRQNDMDQNQMAQMAAQRMAALGPQGEQWAKAIQQNPRSALMMAEQFGGFGEIEANLMNARAQGEMSQAIGRMQDGGSSPEEIVGFILRTQGPKAAQAAAAALGTNTSVSPKAVIGPDGQPVYVDARDAIGKMPVPSKSGMRIEFDANGNPIVTTGISGDGITKPTQSKIEGKQVDIQDTLSRLDAISGAYRPEFQEWGSKARMKVLQTKSSLGQSLTPDEQAQLSDIAGFRSAAFENMSYVLNMLSGAAISPAEAERLKQFLPDPGTGVFDGDDPVTFKRKLDDLDARLRDSISRYRSQKGGALDIVPPPMPKSPGRSSAKSAPSGIPSDAKWDETGQMWVTPDGRVFIEEDD